MAGVVPSIEDFQGFAAARQAEALPKFPITRALLFEFYSCWRFWNLIKC
jgi:hypothetical protein